MARASWRRSLLNGGPVAALAAAGVVYPQMQWRLSPYLCSKSAHAEERKPVAAAKPGSVARVSYTSTMRGNVSTALKEVEAIAAKAANRNRAVGVSGQLCYDARLQRIWQVLEGSPEEVQKLWAAISEDPRHTIEEDTVTMELVDEATYPIGWGLRYIGFAEPSQASGAATQQAGHSGHELVQLKYKSVLKPHAGAEREVMAAILPKAVVKNARNGVTGWMLYNDRNMSVYQVLEGPREAVEKLWETIRADPRHDVLPESVSRRRIACREFANWCMALDEVKVSAWMEQSY